MRRKDKEITDPEVQRTIEYLTSMQVALSDAEFPCCSIQYSS
jgi:hypothetical protein